MCSPFFKLRAVRPVSCSYEYMFERGSWLVAGCIDQRNIAAPLQTPWGWVTDMNVRMQCEIGLNLDANVLHCGALNAQLMVVGRSWGWLWLLNWWWRWPYCNDDDAVAKGKSMADCHYWNKTIRDWRHCCSDNEHRRLNPTRSARPSGLVTMILLVVAARAESPPPRDPIENVPTCYQPMMNNTMKLHNISTILRK